MKPLTPVMPIRSESGFGAGTAEGEAGTVAIFATADFFLEFFFEALKSSPLCAESPAFRLKTLQRCGTAL